MSKNNFSKYYKGENEVALGFLAVADLIALPILIVIAVILAFLGVFTLAYLFSTLFSFAIIGISLLLVIVLFLIGRNRSQIIRIESVKWGLALGFFYWAYGVYNILSKGNFLSAIVSAINLPLLAADMLGFIIWIIIFKMIFGFFSS